MRAKGSIIEDYQNGLKILLRMKSRLILLIVSALILFGSSCMKIPDINHLYGVWQGEHNETELLFAFNNDGTCSLSYKNRDSGEIYILSGTFEVNFSKSPIPLSIQNIPQLNHGLYTIIQFTDNNTLKVADFSPRWRLRPISFQKDTSMDLVRR